MIPETNCAKWKCLHYEGIKMVEVEDELMENPCCKVYPEGIPGVILYGRKPRNCFTPTDIIEIPIESIEERERKIKEKLFGHWKEQFEKKINQLRKEYLPQDNNWVSDVDAHFCQACQQSPCMCSDPERTSTLR
jgi:hypothetical protein